MSIRNLTALLHPRSLALIGASDRAGTLGGIVLDNVLDGGFAGRINVVNPRRIERAGVGWAASVDELAAPPDLAIVMTPAETVPGIVERLGAIGTKCVVVISGGLTRESGLQQRMLDAAKPHLLRIVGPNCLGLVAPRARLNATFARTGARPGSLALISQSGALVTAMLDWADARGIGFSGLVSAGDMADVDVGDLIDLFATDPATDAILLYLEGVTNAAKFLSAARAAAVHKPVIAIKAGRSPVAARAAFSHTGALAGSYDVYRAAFERAGIVAVDTLTELFGAAQTLRLCREVGGDRLAIVTNGGGAGILAVDAMANTGARAAELAPATIAGLDAVMPKGWSRANPVDIIGDAGPDRYRAAIAATLRDENVDALLVMNCPTGRAGPADFAAALAETVAAARGEGNRKPVLACWLGDANARDARAALEQAGIPLYTTPEDAIAGFGYVLAARGARANLTDRPAASREVVRDVESARGILASARAENRVDLNEIEGKDLLAAYGIPVARTRLASDVASVAAACDGLAAPFAVKIVSPEITHKADVGGVVLGLDDAEAAEAAAREMAARIAKARPDARIAGFAVGEMIERPHAYEVLAGIATDATFGPLLMVGAGGTAVEVLADKALTLAPIDHADALALIDRTAIARRLKGFRNVPPADIDGLADVLDALCAMVVDLPDIVELDINPLLVDARGVIALDARVRVTSDPQPVSRMALRPAPMHWSADLVTRSGRRIHVRPVRADDEPLLAEFFEHVSPEDLRFRFLGGVTKVEHDRLAMMTRVDYRRTISFLAFDAEHGAERRNVIATAMLVTEPDRARAEVALATRADAKGGGVSWTLFEHVLRYAKAERIGMVETIEFADHDAALQMARELGFTITSDPDDATLRIATRKL
ncbi:MAG: GNAT family N-acetyltransferase [Novosphingobium sp.]